MFTTALLLATIALLRPALADGAIFTETDAIGTFYYDISETSSSATEACGSVAGDPVVAGWATSSVINGGVPFCESSRGKSLSELGTNAIVAFNHKLISADPGKYCGREVDIYDADGKKFDFSGGQLFIWDGCDACADTNSQKIDLSAPAFVELKGGSCSGNNPTGLRYEILDSYFWEPSAGLGAGYSEVGASATSAGSATQSAADATTTIAAQTTTASTTTVASTSVVLTSTRSDRDSSATQVSTSHLGHVLEVVTAATSGGEGRRDGYDRLRSLHRHGDRHRHSDNFRRRLHIHIDELHLRSMAMFWSGVAGVQLPDTYSTRLGDN